MISTDLIIVALGLVLGSFLYTMVIRLQGDISVWKRSQCDHCSKPIGVVGLVPLLGYILVAGRCKHCGGKISPVYPLVEIGNALFVYALYLKTGWQPEFFHALLVFETLLLVAVLDLRSHLIFPQPILFGLLIQSVWLVYAGKTALLGSLLGLFLGAGLFHWVAYLYRTVRNRDGLGEGDATLLGLVGFFFGWRILLPVVFWGAILGIGGGGLILIKRKQSLTKEIAFGPWLALAALLAWYFPSFFQSVPLKLPVGVPLI